MCICVFSVYLIILFSTFHSWFPPPTLSSYIPTSTVPTHLFVVHFKLPVFAGVGDKGRWRERNERKQEKTEQRKNESERVWLFPHAELVECQNSVTRDWMLSETPCFTYHAQTDMNRQKEKGVVVWKSTEGRKGKHCHSEETSCHNA